MIIEDAIIGEDNDSKFKQKRSFAPSALGFGSGTCPRYWHFALNGVDFIDEKTAAAISNMEAGRDRHERFAEYFEKADGVDIVKVEQELRNEDPPVFGFVDIIIKFQGRKIVGEFKTTSSRNWYAVRKSGKAKDYHMVQILIYMKLLDIEHGFLMYENKDSNQLLFIDVKLSDYDDYVTDILNWMKMVYQNYKDGNIPSRPFEKKSKPCKYCPVFDACWDAEDGSTEIAPLNVE
jgi:CRISPR/Cas system-associated exonuclease Cas4 (RecB family)